MTRVQILTRQEFSFSTITSRLALGHMQSLIQWVPGALLPGVKHLGHEADQSPPSSADSNAWVELYLHSPLCLHIMVLG